MTQILKENKTKIFTINFYFLTLFFFGWIFPSLQNQIRQTTWPLPYDRLVTKSKKKNYGPIIDAVIEEKQNKNFFHQLLFSQTIFFLVGFFGGGRPKFGKPPDPRRMTVWPRNQKRKLWSHYWCRYWGKRKQKFFSSTLIFPNYFFFWLGFSEAADPNLANHPTLAVWPSGHEIKKEKLWSHYWCRSWGKTKQKFFSSTFIFQLLSGFCLDIQTISRPKFPHDPPQMTENNFFLKNSKFSIFMHSIVIENQNNNFFRSHVQKIQTWQKLVGVGQTDRHFLV